MLHACRLYVLAVCVAHLRQRGDNLSSSPIRSLDRHERSFPATVYFIKHGSNFDRYALHREYIAREVSRFYERERETEFSAR